MINTYNSICQFKINIKNFIKYKDKYKNPSHYFSSKGESKSNIYYIL
jgi:hypothetical protein